VPSLNGFVSPIHSILGLGMSLSTRVIESDLAPNSCFYRLEKRSDLLRQRAFL
jgi:hypothetical protein